MVWLLVERIYKFLQITALVVALFAPWIYFVGYAYDWGYLDSFAIERQMFFKAPQEYFGLAYQVFLLVITEIFKLISEEVLVIAFASIVFVVVVALTAVYFFYRMKFWPKYFLRSSNLAWRMRGFVTKRFMTTVAVPGYLFSSIPVMLFAIGIYITLCFLLPPLIGYSNGQKEARKIQETWHTKKCTLQAPIVGCTQVLEEEKVIASGRLIVASDKFAALYDGSAVQMYSLRNRDIKTVLKRD